MLTKKNLMVHMVIKTGGGVIPIRGLAMGDIRGVIFLTIEPIPNRTLIPRPVMTELHTTLIITQRPISQEPLILRLMTINETLIPRLQIPDKTLIPHLVMTKLHTTLMITQRPMSQGALIPREILLEISRELRLQGPSLPPLRSLSATSRALPLQAHIRRRQSKVNLKNLPPLSRVGPEGVQGLAQEFHELLSKAKPHSHLRSLQSFSHWPFSPPIPRVPLATPNFLLPLNLRIKTTKQTRQKRP